MAKEGGSGGGVRESILKNLDSFKEMSPEETLNQRKNKFLKIGRGKGFIHNPESLSTIENKNKNIGQFFKNRKKIYYMAGSILLIVILMVSFL